MVERSPSIPMQTISDIRDLLAERGLRPKHKLGQNFLHDKNQLSKLIAAAEIKTSEVILEVGPGTGTLTEALLETEAEVITCELDRDLAQIIEEQFGDRVTLLQGNCLDKGRTINPMIEQTIQERPFKLVANLPYSIASPLMTTLLIDHQNCVGMYITIQQEVADRLLAKPSTKAFGPLGIIVQTFAHVERITVVKPTSFWPQPKVSSAMVSIIPSTDCDIDDRAGYAQFVVQLFMKRRKQLGKVFPKDFPWPNGVTRTMRPDALSIHQIMTLWRISNAL